MDEMSPEERARYDAQARVEAWEFAIGILGPWVEAARAIGSEELTQVMEKALSEGEGELELALYEREAAEAPERS
jgi:hypothetical protein